MILESELGLDIDVPIPGISIHGFDDDSSQKVITIEKSKRCAAEIACGIAANFSDAGYGIKIREDKEHYEVHVLSN